jgi:hypothetical protein
VEFAIGDDRAELWGRTVVFDNLYAVEPVLAVGALDDDARGVPLADRFNRLVRRGGDHVIERGKGAVAVFALLGVGVQGVIEDLVFKADVGAAAFVASRQVEVDEVDDARVGARCDPKVYRQFKVGVLAYGDNVAGVATFFTAALCNREEAVLDLPTIGGKPENLTLRQPAEVLPSKKSCQPAAFSCAERVFGIWPNAGRAASKSDATINVRRIFMKLP